jgi:hypothetical protein
VLSKLTHQLIAGDFVKYSLSQAESTSAAGSCRTRSIQKGSKT